MTTAKRPVLAKEFDYYVEHQDELVQQHDGRVVVIKGCKVLGAYDSYGEAVAETQKHHKLGTFLAQLVTSGRDAYTITFHSREMKF